MPDTRLQKALAAKRLADARRRLQADTDDSAELTMAEALDPDHDTDVQNIDDNPVSIEEAREPDDKTDVTELPDPGSETPSKTSRRRAEYIKAKKRQRAAAFGDPDDQTDPAAPPAAAPAGPPAADPAADPTAPPAADDGGPTTNSGDELADSLPIDWKQDESGQAYGTIQGTDLDIFINDDKSWQVLPEGSQDPIAQGQGQSFDDALQQAFDAGSGINTQAGGDPNAAPADPTAAPAAGGPDPIADDQDPTKRAARRKRADGKTPDGAAADARVDVEKLKDHPEDVDPGTYSESDYANNAGDDLAKPQDGSDVFNMKPGGGSFKDENKTASRKTSAAKASELADLYQSLGLIENTRVAKYKLVAELEKLPAVQTNDRLALLGQVESKVARSAPRTAASSRGTRVPNVGPRRTASSAGNDAASDYLVSLR